MPAAFVIDPEGPKLTPDERAFYRDADPYGFILFARHCQDPEQMRRLIGDCRDAIGRCAPVLIDQEGGRVSRMVPHAHERWRSHPPMAVFGELFKLDPYAARQAAWLNACLIGTMLNEVGVDVNCTPMLDIPQIDSDPVTLGDRAIAAHADIIVPIAEATIAGLGAAGVKPIIKHIPGLGRAECDSHEDLPVVSATLDDLRTADFAPFRALASAPAAMTAHIVYNGLDADACATESETVIDRFIRGEIGFEGLLFSDDIKMKALSGAYPARGQRALAAGCDLVLACNLTIKDQIAIAGAIDRMTSEAQERADRFEKFSADQPADLEQPLKTYEELDRLLRPVSAPVC